MLWLCETDLTETRLVFKYKFLLEENNTITTNANNSTNTIIEQ